MARGLQSRVPMPVAVVGPKGAFARNASGRAIGQRSDVTVARPAVRLASSRY
jgi:hypothetical protein